VTWEEPTRLIGDGHQARIRAERVGSRRSDTPATPGDAWGPPCSATRRYGTASPRGLRTGVGRAGAQVSTGDGTVVGFPQQRRPRGTLGELLTWGQWSVRERDQERCRGREHARARGLDDPVRGRRQRADHQPARVPMTGGVSRRSRVRWKRSGTVLQQRRGERCPRRL
jgi:hypothetical protein